MQINLLNCGLFVIEVQMKKVRWIGHKPHPNFKDGQVYEVEKEDRVEWPTKGTWTPTYHIKGGFNHTGGYFQHAFEVVYEQSDINVVCVGDQVEALVGVGTPVLVG